MPGYEPFLLCDFHVHTRWSDGRLPLREVIDLYGATGSFDVIAITDHVLMERDFLARAGRLASLGFKQFSVTEDAFGAYLADMPRRRSARDAVRSARHPRRRGHAEPSSQQEELAHYRAEHSRVHQRRPVGRSDSERHSTSRGNQHRLSSGSPDDAPCRDGTCYLWDNRKRLAGLVDVWEAANRDDLFSVTSLKHFPYVANSDFHKPKHLYSWKTLLRCEKNWDAIARALRANVDVALTLYRNGEWVA